MRVLALAPLAVIMNMHVASAAAAAGVPPNILYILGDDHGHADMGYRGGKARTPQMDGFAGQGLKIDGFYTQPICSATRSSLLTGRYVHRLGFQHFNPPKLGGGVGAIPLRERLLPQFMADQGYACHLVGKWHGGMIKKAYLPHNRGFQSAFGYYEGSIDYYTHTVKQGKYVDFHYGTPGAVQTCEPKFNGTYDLDIFVNRTLAIIRAHDPSKPLFMYLPLHSVHEPDEVPARFYNMYPNETDVDNRRTMLAMVTAMDEGIGKVVAGMQTKGAAFWQNSIVFYHSDNGGPTYADAGTSNLPLRGSKLSPWEGGVRVNAWVYSPGLLPASRAGGVVPRDQLFHVTDMLPTLYGLAGGNVLAASTKYRWDGMDMCALLRGEVTASPRHEIVHLIDPLGNEALVMVSPTVAVMGCKGNPMPGACSRSAALRQGDMKLVVGMFALCATTGPKGTKGATERMCGWHAYDAKSGAASRLPTDEALLCDLEMPAVNDDAAATARLAELLLPVALRHGTAAPAAPPVVLYNISADPTERNDLSKAMPEVVSAMLARIDAEAASEWMDPQWPGFSVCDTPGGSCAMQQKLYDAAATRKGCVDVYIPENGTLASAD